MALIIALRDTALFSLKVDYFTQKLQIEKEESYLKLCTYAQVLLCTLQCDVPFGLESCVYTHPQDVSAEGES